jgi:hypothetical protein
VASVLFRFPLPLIANERSAVIALAAIMGCKLVLYLVRTVTR